MPTLLSCQGLWKLYGPRASGPRVSGPVRDPAALAASGHIAAVRDVSLSVETGEIFVIMGLSGSGKSTLLRCLSRLIEPSAGSVTFDGIDLLAAPPARLVALRRHRMGMVFQSFALLPHLTALENVAFPLAMQGTPRPVRETRAAEVLALVGLAGREGQFPRHLSGGQQQRVGIARSLAADPDLWFLDEPFSALDPLIRAEMQGEFLRLQRDLAKTIVFITHDMDEAVRLADRIAIMKDGALVQVATPEDLILAPADPYVRAFTAEVPRARVVTLGRLAVDGPAEGLETLPAATRVAEVADRLLETGRPVAVERPGRAPGVVAPQAVLAVVLGKDRAP
jgi:glycine betaine/proline transport system ATP-binding protein